MIFSGTKGVVATALLLLVDRGALDLDAPVADHLAGVRGRRQGGASRSRSWLAHAAGLPGVDRRWTRTDLADPRRRGRRSRRRRRCVDRWGARATTRSPTAWLAGELIRRADGRSRWRVRARRRWPGRSAASTCRIGLAATDPLAARLARPQPAARLPPVGASWPTSPIRGSSTSTATRRFARLLGRSRPARASRPPAVNGVATARAMATLYGAAGLRPRGAPAHGCPAPPQPASEGDDPLTGRPLRFGPTGYELAGTPSQLGPAGRRVRPHRRRRPARTAPGRRFAPASRTLPADLRPAGRRRRAATAARGPARGGGGGDRRRPTSCS